MSDTDDSGAGSPRIDAAAKAAFLAALRRGARREDAAAEAGFSLMGFYGARRRDSLFADAWVEALAASAAEERRARAYAERGGGAKSGRGEERIASANRRIYQRRVRRNVRFDADAQALFLAHFAATCDLRAAAAAAGVAESTVTLHRRRDPAFAEAFGRALGEGYVALEAEAVRQRLEAQRRLRAAVESACPEPNRRGPGGGAPPAALDAGAEFDRVMKLLARWDRRGDRPGFREVRHGRQRRMSFEEAILLLDKKLRALGVRRGIIPPAEE